MASSLGEWIRDRRIQFGWTQQQLADKLGVTDITISNWENGHSCPQPSNLQAIENALGELPAFATSVERSEEDRTTTPFGAWLRNTRLSKGLSQIELAERAGVSDITISYIETGRTQSPRPQTIRALKDALGETLTAEVEEDLEAEQEVGEGLGDYYGPFPVEDWEEHAEAVPCVYVLYDDVQRPVRIGETGSLKERLRQYKADCWWFRAPTASAFAYVEVADEKTRKQIEKVIIKFVGNHASFNIQHRI